MGCHGTNDDKFNKKRYFRAVIDRFKTKYASEHSNEEIVNWFFENSFDDLKIGNGTKVCITGTKINNRKNSFRKVNVYI